jgi:uncharacterized membrane protein
MLDTLLTFHNITRWLVVIAGVLVIARAITGLRGRPWSQPDDRAGMLYTIALDVQLLLGLILFFVSPITTRALQDFGAAMQNSQMRFFSVEHSLVMLIAVVVAHVARSLSKKAPTDPQKFRRALIGFGLSFVLLLAAIPWQRPLLRLFGIEI